MVSDYNFSESLWSDATFLLYGGKSMANKTDNPRNEKIVSRFTSQEMAHVEELRRRLNISTCGKMVRVIILAVAKNPEFDFLAYKNDIWNDLPHGVRENIALISKIDETLDLLNNQGLFDKDSEVSKE